MRDIPVGATGSFALTVAPQHLAIQFKDAILPPVLATPMMILMMEQAAMSAIVPYLDAGETSVGMLVNVEHLAATPIAHAVRAEAEVMKVDGRRIEFRVAAFDEQEQIGRGTHRRAVVELAKFKQRVQAKLKP